MQTLHVTSETTTDGVVERDFLVGDIPGVLWAPESAPGQAAVVLLGHNGGMHKRAPGLRARMEIQDALAAVEPRITAAIFGGGFFVDDPVLAAARQVTVPVQFLLPWDDEYGDRASGLALFDAFASAEKTLHANPGAHRTVRWVGLDDAFLSRHLVPA